MKFIYILSFSLLFLNCNQIKTKNTSQGRKNTVMDSQGNFAHTVYFWLKNPESNADRKAFETSLKKFVSTSKYIVSKHIGVPAATTDRGVVDGTYTYSLLLTFKDKTTQDLYQDEPAHLLFLKESEDLWSKVIVYDSENIL